jgi:hypothetical protein
MVTIVIEEGAGKVPVPKLIALGLSDARKRLHQAGFRLGAVDPDPPPAAATVRRQDPAEDALALRGTSVAVALTVPAPDQGPPVAFVDGGRILLKTPGRSARPLAGGEGIDDTDPAWDPRTGELAFAERRPPAGDAAIVAIDPASPDVPHRLSGPGGSYTSPGFSPRGDLLAAVDDDGSGYGGRLCLFAPPARVAHCRTDASWRYGRPAFGDERTLYALRRNTSTRRRGGWDQLLRLTAQAPGKVGPRAWVPDPNPVVEGDLLSVAVASDGRLAALVRDPGKAYYHVEVLSPDGSLQQAQTGAEPSCELAWSAKDLLVSRWSCTEDHPPGDVIRLPADDLNGPAQKIVAQGEDPAPEPM